MIASILQSVKKALGLPADHEDFDEDIIMHINSVFSTLHQLGVGPAAGFMIEDANAEWDAFLGGLAPLNNVKSYVYLRVRLLFDPPQNSFTITAMEKQVSELEWRINAHRESTAWVDPDPNPLPVDDYIMDGGSA